MSAASYNSLPCYLLTCIAGTSDLHVKYHSGLPVHCFTAFLMKLTDMR